MRGKYKKVPVDVDEVIIDPAQEKKKRIASFISQVKTPYLVKIDGVIVEMEYQQDGETMEEVLELAMDI